MTGSDQNEAAVLRPNLYILGAPKCGTSTLASWLGQHPEIFVSSEKEPHYFYSPYPQKMSLTDYEKLFSASQSTDQYRAEASVWYLFGKTAVPKIIDYSPQSKFIVCLRNPVEMSPSLHSQTLFIGRELEADFATAWALSERRSQGFEDKVFGFKGGDVSCMAYKQTCMLGDQIAHLLTQVGRERVHFVLLEDMAARPQQTWQQVLGFLQLSDAMAIDFKAENSAKKRRFIGLQRLTLFLQNAKRSVGFKKRFGLLAFFNRRNIVPEPYSSPPPALVREMRAAFSADIERLSELIGRDLSHWVRGE